MKKHTFTSLAILVAMLCAAPAHAESWQWKSDLSGAHEWNADNWEYWDSSTESWVQTGHPSSTSDSALFKSGREATLAFSDTAIVGTVNIYSTVDFSGGTLQVGDPSATGWMELYIAGESAAEGSAGTLNVKSGTIKVVNTSDQSNTLDVGRGPSTTATLTVEGGTVMAENQVRLAYGTDSVATLNLNGGSLQVGKIALGSGTGTINFNGGALTPLAENTSDFIATGISKVIHEGGMVVSNDVAVTIDMTGFTAASGVTPRLVKKGTAVLTLTNIPDSFGLVIEVAKNGGSVATYEGAPVRAGDHTQANSETTTTYEYTNTKTTWTGASGDGCWSTAANWSAEEVPSSTTAVSITNDAAITVDSSAVYFASLAVGGAVTLQQETQSWTWYTIKAYGNITGAGTISVSGGQIDNESGSAISVAPALTAAGAFNISGGSSTTLSSFTVNAGIASTQYGTLVVSGETSLGDGVALNYQYATFGDVAIDGTASITNDYGIIFGGNITGALELTAKRSATFSGNLSGSGNITVDAQDSSYEIAVSGSNSAFTGRFAKTGAGNLVISSTTAVSASSDWDIVCPMKLNSLGDYSFGSLNVVRRAKGTKDSNGNDEYDSAIIIPTESSATTDAPNVITLNICGSADSSIEGNIGWNTQDDWNWNLESGKTQVNMVKTGGGNFTFDCRNGSGVKLTSLTLNGGTVTDAKVDGGWGLSLPDGVSVATTIDGCTVANSTVDYTTTYSLTFNDAAGYMEDSTTAVVTNTASEVTVPSGATAVKVAITGDSVTLSTSLASSAVTVYATDDNGAIASTVIDSGALSFDTATSGKITIALNANGTVGEVSVKPVVDTDADSSMTVTSSEVGLSVKTIAGLWYGLGSATSVDATSWSVDGANAQVGTGETLSLTADIDSADTVKFFRAKTALSKAALTK